MLPSLAATIRWRSGHEEGSGGERMAGFGKDLAARIFLRAGIGRMAARIAVSARLTPNKDVWFFKFIITTPGEGSSILPPGGHHLDHDRLFRSSQNLVAPYALRNKKDNSGDKLQVQLKKRLESNRSQSTEAFVAISKGNLDSVMNKLKTFAVILYNRFCEHALVNEARRALFTNKKRTMEMIPPTANAL
uniref:Uncharacterized protein n=1 Tax=Timema tahoe TaxID=61484 RepID=A0A7R9NW02_9NEOP|nr:unnamed protein product [Timema tahoe]